MTENPSHSFTESYEIECPECDGTLYVDGSRIADYYDYGWIDPRKSYRCPLCGDGGVILIDGPREEDAL